MKRTLTLALGVVLGAAFAAPAFAQEGFPDTPENHWAFEAVAKLKAAGLLTGYPDGMFRGGRPASRYELAVALYALYQHLSKMNDSMSKSIKDLEEKMGGNGPDPSGFASKAELQAVKDQLASMKSGLDSMRGWGDEIANFKKNLDALKGDLASMGVDVEALKKGLGDLDARVKKLEGMKLPVQISGDLDLWLGGGYSDDRHYGVTVDGRPTGFNYDNRPTGFAHDLTILHSMTVKLGSNSDEKVQWKAAMVYDNLMGQGSISADAGPTSTGKGSPSVGAFGEPFSEGESDFYFQEFNAWWDFSMGKVKVGRVGFQSSPHLFKRPDVTPYYTNEYWDGGDWFFDGAIVSSQFGSTKFNLFGGRQSDRLTNNGEDLNHMHAGAYWHPVDPLYMRPIGFSDNNAMSVDQHLGLTASTPLGNRGNLNVMYAFLDTNNNRNLGGSPTVAINRVAIFGGDMNFHFGDFTLNGAFGQSNLMLDSHTVEDSNNTYWDVNGAWKRDKWGIKGGYKHVDPLFGAPGDWGRLGMWWNPTDIEGFYFDAYANLTDRLSITGKADFFKGTETCIRNSWGLLNDDKITSFKLDATYKCPSGWNFVFGAEWVTWELTSRDDSNDGFNGAKPVERWYRIGLRNKLSEHAHFSLLWEMSDVDAKGVGSFRPTPFLSNDLRAKGGFITSQLTVRF